MSNATIPGRADEWRGSVDALGRKRDADFLTELLEGRFLRGRAGQPNSLVLNIDAPWGTGKTFLLDRWGADLQEKGWRVLRFNAWEHDYAADPLLSFIAELREQIEKNRPKTEKSKAAVRTLSVALGKQLAPAVAKSVAQMGAHLLLGPAAGALTQLFSEEFIGDAEKGAGEAASKLVENAAERMLKEAQAVKRNLASFKTALEKYAATASPEKPVVLLIDELDRCRPTFSIDLLEVLKHVFSVAGVYSVVATDTAQLAHSAKNIYGSEFEAKEYLKRFFDLRYDLGNPDGQSLMFHLLKEHGLLDDDRLLAPTANTGLQSDPKRPRCYTPLLPNAVGPSDLQAASRAMFLIAAKDQLQLTNRDARRAVELIRAVVDSFIARTQGQQPPAKLHFPYLAILAAAYVKNEELLQSEQKLYAELARSVDRSIGAGPWDAHRLGEILVFYESELRSLAQRDWKRDQLGPDIVHLREQNLSSDKLLREYRAMVARCGHIASASD